MAPMGLFVLLLCLFALRTSADIYMHNPCGSNNRLDDENRDRNNANRCFDSQNNNRGGCNVGQLYYYAGSTLYMDWTNQHSCGNPNNNCEIIIQYACDPLVRDGTSQNTIPITNQDCINFKCDTDVRYCRHESLDSYLNGCLYRQRNKGLFTANQPLQGDSAVYTRQNPNGARRGLECPEERDYYPYWHPTIWRDLAVYTNNPTRCQAIQAASQNVQYREYCQVPTGWVAQRMAAQKPYLIPINKLDCENNLFVSYTDPSTNKTTLGTWTRVPAFGIQPPTCVDNIWTRDNHLGNVAGGFPASFNFTVPGNIISENCVLRIRYNISTGDFPGWANDSSVQAGFVNASLNSAVVGDPARYPALVDLWTAYNLTYADVADSFNTSKNGNPSTLTYSREYVLKNNPQVNIFGSLLSAGGLIKLQLAVNTAQYGRTFQDRSHRFAIRAAPSNVNGKTLHNLRVQGKRGNIVQTFPGTEYDFHPYNLQVKEGDWIHFMWTGSNNNPDNNAGQGRQGSDRHNVIALKPANYYEVGQDFSEYGHWGNSYPAKIPADGLTATNTTWRFLGLSHADLETLAILSNIQLGGNMKELNDAGTFFDLGPRQISSPGVYHYMCTRNNNFSNRSQKALIVVSSEGVTSGTLGRNPSSLSSSDGSATVSVSQDTLTGPIIVSLSTDSSPANASITNINSPYVTVQPVILPVAAGQSVTIKIKFNNNPLGSAAAYRADSITSSFHKIHASISGDVATISTTQGGVFIVRDPNNYGAIFGVTIAVIIVVGVAVYLIWKRYKAKKATTTAAVKSTIAPPPAASSSSAVAVNTGDQQLPAGWQAVSDPNDGATYYVHASKGLSQWEFPSE